MTEPPEAGPAAASRPKAFAVVLGIALGVLFDSSTMVVMGDFVILGVIFTLGLLWIGPPVVGALIGKWAAKRVKFPALTRGQLIAFAVGTIGAAAWIPFGLLWARLYYLSGTLPLPPQVTELTRDYKFLADDNSGPGVTLTFRPSQTKEGVDSFYSRRLRELGYTQVYGRHDRYWSAMYGNSGSLVEVYIECDHYDCRTQLARSVEVRYSL